MKIIGTTCNLCPTMKFGNSQAKYLWEKGFCRIENKITNCDRLQNLQLTLQLTYC